MSLSVILPCIRPHQVDRVYKSILNTYNNKFELIVVGPSDVGITKWSNVKFIQDWGNPTRAMQIGLVNASCKYCAWFSDDSYFLNDSLNILSNKIAHQKHIVTCKYTEGLNPGQEMYDDHYYTIGVSCFGAQFVPPEWKLLNLAVMNTAYLKSLGGFDCRFESTIFSVTDLGVRAQRDGAQVEIINLMGSHSDHMEGRTGDHAPIHDAFEQNDMPLYKEIYNNSESLNRVLVDLNNWEKSPAKWSRRF